MSPETVPVRFLILVCRRFDSCRGRQTGSRRPLRPASRVDEAVYGHCTNVHVEAEQEEGDRWIGAVPELPGVLVYAATRRRPFR